MDVLTMTVQSDGTHEAEHLLMGAADTACTLTLIRAVGGEGNVKFEELFLLFEGYYQRTMHPSDGYFQREAQHTLFEHQKL